MAISEKKIFIAGHETIKLFSLIKRINGFIHKYSGVNVQDE